MKKCEWCGEEITKKQNLFCNRICYSEWNKSFRVKKICIVCFKEYRVPNCRESTSTTCSPACRAQIAGEVAKRVHIDAAKSIKTCLQCKKIFEIPKSKTTWIKNGTHGIRKFCCKACQTQYRKDNVTTIAITCKYCGNVKTVKAHKKDAKYCSRACKWAFERTVTCEKSPSYKHGFKIYRREALKLFEYKCGYCNKVHRRLHVHHIDGDNKNNIPSNWIVLCEPCHRRVHLGLIALPLGVAAYQSSSAAVVAE